MVRTGKRLISISSPEDASAAAFGFASGNSQVIVGRRNGMVTFFEVATGRELRAFSLGQGDEAVAFSPDGRFMAGSAQSLWDTSNGSKVGEFPSSDNADGFSPSLTVAVFGSSKMEALTAYSGGDAALLWQYPKPRLLQTFKHGQTIESLALSPDGSRVATGSSGGSVIIWDAITGKRLQILGPSQDWVRSAAFSSDGRQVIIELECGENTLWDLAAGGKTANALPSTVTDGSMISPYGKLKIDPQYFPPRVIEVNSGKTLTTLAGAGVDPFCGGFAMHGRSIVAASAHKIFAWNLDGDARRTLLGEFPDSPRLAISPSGDRIAVILHSEVQLWDLASRRQLATFVNSRLGSEWLVISPEGYFDGTNAGCQLITWKLGDAVFPVEQFEKTFHRPDLIANSLGGRPLKMTGSK